MRSIAFSFVVISMIALGATDRAQAAEPQQRTWPSQSQRYQPAIPPCTCRAMGRDFLIGESICLRQGTRARRAICGMDLNVTSWSMTDESCESSLLQSRQLD